MINPLVSIIIPVYNAEKYILETIHSIIHQTYENYEVIVVDDGSTDSSIELIEHLEGNRFKIISQKNRGASAARNIGIKNAYGDYIQFLDADDLMHPDKIKNQIEILKNEDKYTLAFCPWIRIYKHLEVLNYLKQDIDKDYNEPYKLLRDMWNGKGMVQPGAWLLSKELVSQVGYWDETISLNDDGEYFCRVILASIKIKFCSNAIVYYRSGLTTSLSKQRTYKAISSHFNSLENYVINCQTHEFFDDLKAPLSLNFSDFIYQYYNINTPLCQKAKEKIMELGFKNIPPTGGKKFRLLAQIIGFERALFLKKISFIVLMLLLITIL